MIGSRSPHRGGAPDQSRSRPARRCGAGSALPRWRVADYRDLETGWECSFVHTTRPAIEALRRGAQRADRLSEAMWPTSRLRSHGKAARSGVT